jgi:FkbM family methyltransferase
MEKYKGFYLPKGEEHYKKKIDRWGHYQKGETNHAITFVKDFSAAYDVGANIGFWSMMLLHVFKEVRAFEPVKEFRQCFAKNVKAANIKLEEFGLSDKTQQKRIQWDRKASGRASVSKSDMHLLPNMINEIADLLPLDSLKVEKLSFIKLDCEGYEYFILKGAEKTIKKFKPIINIEDKFERYGLERGESLKLLESWGAKLLGRYSDDCVYGWE